MIMHAAAFLRIILSFSLFSFAISLSMAPVASKAIIALNTRMIVKREFITDFQKAVCSTVVQTLAKPGCTQVVVGTDAPPDGSHGNNAVFYMHNQYENLKAYQEHGQLQGFLQKVGSMLEAEQPLSNRFLLQTNERGPVSLPTNTGSDSSGGRYCLNVESCVKPEIRDDFVQLLTNHAIKSHKEPACLQFDWGESIDAANSFYMHEEYTDLDGFKAHKASAHFAKFIKFNEDKQPYTQPQEVGFYETIQIK